MKFIKLKERFSMAEDVTLESLLNKPLPVHDCLLDRNVVLYINRKSTDKLDMEVLSSEHFQAIFTQFEMQDKEGNDIYLVRVLEPTNKDLTDYINTYPNELGIRKVLFSLLKGLAHLHRNNVLLQGLSPNHVIIQQSSNDVVAKLNLDAMVAKREFLLERTTGGRLRNYVSPEQLYHNILNKKSNSWSFGALVYELFTGDRFLVMPNSDGLSKDFFVNLKSIPEPYQSLVKNTIRFDPSQRSNIDELLELFSEDKQTEQSNTPSESWFNKLFNKKKD